MTKPKISDLDKLFEDIGTFRRSSEYLKLIEFVKKFPHIAPYNAMLIHIQKPGSVYVASPLEWKERFNRDIKPEARPLVILKPFGPVSFVFELNDTVGDDPFPKELLNPFFNDGEISQYTFDMLIENMKKEGILYHESDVGTNLAGYIKPNSKKDKIIIIQNDKEIYIEHVFDMVVNKNHPIETKFATVLHELGHAYCGHLGAPYYKWCDDRGWLSINEREFEAESVCWLVCERLGINNPSAEYLSGYFDNNEKIPRISVDKVLKSVAIIESLIKSKRKVRKELIIDKD